MNIVTFEGQALDELLDYLGRAQMRGGVVRLRVADDDGALKVKVNEDTWSAPLGVGRLRCQANIGGEHSHTAMPCDELAVSGTDVCAAHQPAPARPGHELRTPRKAWTGWEVRCTCGWRRVCLASLGEAAAVAHWHELNTDALAGV